MKKKIIAVLLLSAVFAGNVFAQEEEMAKNRFAFFQDWWRILLITEEEMAKNRIAFSAGIIIGELSYERVLSSYLSVLTQVSYNNLFLVADSFSVAAKGRWYPFGGAFFLDMGLVDPLFADFISPFGSAFFLDLGLGYSYGYNILNDAAYALGDILLIILTFGLWALTPEFQSHYSDEIISMGGFFIQPGLGWNIDIGNKDGFRLPIAMGLDIRLAEVLTIIPNLKIGLSYSF